MKDATQTMRGNSRPVLPMDRSAIAWLLEGLSVLGLAGCLLIPMLWWGQLPDKIPRHFDFAGKPDGWGGRGLLWLLPGIVCVLYLGLSLIARFPHRLNYPFDINEQNAARQYRIVRSLMAVLKTEVVLLFAYIEWGAIRTALGQSPGLSPAFTPIVIVAVLGTIMAYLVAAIRSR